MSAKLTNEIIDTDYTSIIPKGGYPVFKPPQKKGNFIDNILNLIFGQVGKSKSKKDKQAQFSPEQKRQLHQKTKELIKKDKVTSKDLDQQLRKYLLESEKEYKEAVATYKTYIAPSYWEFTPAYFNLSGLFGKTYYANRYPSYLDMLRTRDLLSLHGKWDTSWFIYPSESDRIAKMLRDRATQLRQEINEALRK